MNFFPILNYTWIACIALFLNVWNLNASQTIEFYSQHQQDRYLYETLFQGKANGIFVDIGAHDGVAFSNTYFFEKFLGWDGICVEPIPEVFESLKKNRSVKCIQGCISNREGSASFLRIKGYSEMLSGILDKYEPDHLRRAKTEIDTFNQYSEIITVECYDLTKVLVQNNMRHVDLLSLDTEGGELGILQSIDFNIISIDVIDVENNAGTNQFRNFLEPRGYSLIAKLGCDEIYLSSNFRK